MSRWFTQNSNGWKAWFLEEAPSSDKHTKTSKPPWAYAAWGRDTGEETRCRDRMPWQWHLAKRLLHGDIFHIWVQICCHSSSSATSRHVGKNCSQTQNTLICFKFSSIQFELPKKSFLLSQHKMNEATSLTNDHWNSRNCFPNYSCYCFQQSSAKVSRVFQSCRRWLLSACWAGFSSLAGWWGGLLGCAPSIHI